MKRLHTTTYALLAALLLLPLPAAAQDATQDAARAGDPAIRHFEISRAASAVKVDGLLDEDAWKNALVIDLPYEWFPGDNVKPPVDTECLLTYSENTLYVAFRAYDPDPSAIRAHLMDRDQAAAFVQDDYVGVMIDSFNDERRAFQFRVNPVGVQVDANFDDFEGFDDFAWDAIWSSRARITGDGYVVEMAIPLNQLRFPRTQESQTWGIEAFRNYPRSDRHRISSRITDRDKECTLCMENKVSGFEGLSPGLNLEVNPTLTGVRTEARDGFPDGDLQTQREDEDLGLDVRWGLTNNLALNATYNPDFSQVEADTAQLDVNTRFALFFPEKRPFFLEGSDIFDTPLAAVFTRTVADPKAGLKLTGKSGKNVIGVFLTEDEQNNLILPGNQGSSFAFLDDEVTAGVVRLRRDVGKRSAVGLLYAGREGTDYYNRVGGVDGILRIDTSNSIRFQWLRSETLYPDEIAVGLGADTFEGDALHLSLLHISRDWFGNLVYEDLDEEFRADSGFMPRVDVQSAKASVERRFWGRENTWYKRWTLGVDAERIEDQSGLVTDEGMTLIGTLDGPMQSFARLRFHDRDEYFAGTVFGIQSADLFYQVKPTGSFVTNGFLRFGDAIDYSNGQAADEALVNVGVFTRLGRHVGWDLDYLVQTLDVAGGELFEAELTQMKVLYQFNVRSFVRAIFQHTAITRDPELYFRTVDDRTEELFTQLLFSYRLNARTVLFAGYTDNRFGFELNEGLLDVPLRQTDRTFFLKLGYAFLF